MPSNSGLSRLGVNSSGIIDNLGDAQGDNLEPVPEALKVLRAETITESQFLFNSQAVKSSDVEEDVYLAQVAVSGNPLAASTQPVYAPSSGNYECDLEVVAEYSMVDDLIF